MSKKKHSVYQKSSFTKKELDHSYGECPLCSGIECGTCDRISGEIFRLQVFVISELGYSISVSWDCVDCGIHHNLEKPVLFGGNNVRIH